MTRKNKIAIVTGAGSGIGRALCLELAERGTVVVAADVAITKAEQTIADLQQRGGQGRAAKIDVGSEAQVTGLVADTVTEYGKLDYMINNAGIGIGGDARDLQFEHWEKVFAVNWWGVLYGTRAAYDQMAKQGFGHIANVSSLSGMIPHPFSAAYSASKHAVVGLSLALRAEGIDLGVRVSAICPGYVETDIFQTMKILNVPEDEVRKLGRPKGISPRRAAMIILQGLDANKRIITFPLRDRWFWNVYRLAPRLVEKVMMSKISERARLIRSFRN